MSFVKLSDTLLDSSVWNEPDPIRIVWITLLLMASPEGVVSASVSGLAHRARVPVDRTREALASFLGPDPESRDGTTGERIEVVPGGWLVLNHTEYRDRRTPQQIETARRVAKHRAAKRGQEPEGSNAPTSDETPRNGTHGAVTPSNEISPLEAEAEAEAEGKKKTRARRAGHAAARPSGVSEPIWRDFLRVREAKRAPLTETALRAIEKQAGLAGWTLEQALIESVARGWAAFRADWVAGGGRRKEASRPMGGPPEHQKGSPFGVKTCDCPLCVKFRKAHPGKTSWRLDGSEPEAKP